jgi:hypothetical protein
MRFSTTRVNHKLGRECKHAESGRKRVCGYACARKPCVLHLRPVRLLRISHSRRFGEGVTGRGRTARNRVPGNTRLDRRRKPEGLRAEASACAEHWRFEVDYGFIYRDCEVVMNARNIVTFWIVGGALGVVARLRMNCTTFLSRVKNFLHLGKQYA